uniref:Alkyl transferase n=1 Tax=Aegilops tauschii subsp. strangulata TaxID=200361 RepID=A0A453JC01_AEGTS
IDGGVLPWHLQAEVDFLMALIERFINDNLAEFMREGTRLRIIGDRSRLPVSVQKTARDAEEATRNNSRLHLVLAISYSGRMDIVQACRKLAQKVDAKLLRPEDIDESLFADELQTSCAADEASSSCPDLLIRTSGELRLSNFLLWQSAYSELFFTDTLWPDFGEAQYLQALRAFQSRDRRFGARKNNAAL